MAEDVAAATGPRQLKKIATAAGAKAAAIFALNDLRRRKVLESKIKNFSKNAKMIRMQLRRSAAGKCN